MTFPFSIDGWQSWDLPRACPNSGAVVTTTAILAQLTKAQIERETSNDNRGASGLKETAATGFPNYPLFARDSFLDHIRQAPEFIQFMTDQKAQWEKYRQEFGG